ncbi:nuclear transport factor 2 family protein [Saccharothrix obliqua]|uniref:nuclear transport factor 2 family protein n=1 Tax=Saccharothrix obliqua TaxID=2861747 RepID=UPI001C5E7C2C|nr:nuclear transport factor 2 family protein [Saccharothrix obliqua]MBW4716914.1 nuclear transport factor 2 family protein [Saccharothrix obliqua]
MTHRRGDVTMAVEKLVARWAAKDTAGLSRLFADGVRWWTAPVPGAPWPAEARNPREVESFFLAFRAVLELTAITTRGLVVDGPDAVLTGRLHARVQTTGLTLAYDFAIAVSVHGGLVTEFRMYADTLAIARALAPDVPPVSP